MKASLLVAISIVPVVALADDPLPKRPDFNRYQAMLNRSPFAIATVAVATATPDFAKDLYVANLHQLQRLDARKTGEDFAGRVCNEAALSVNRLFVDMFLRGQTRILVVLNQLEINESKRERAKERDKTNAD